MMRMAYSCFSDGRSGFLEAERSDSAVDRKRYETWAVYGEAHVIVIEGRGHQRVHYPCFALQVLVTWTSVNNGYHFALW